MERIAEAATERNTEEWLPYKRQRLNRTFQKTAAEEEEEAAAAEEEEEEEAGFPRSF